MLLIAVTALTRMFLVILFWAVFMTTFSSSFFQLFRPERTSNSYNHIA